MLLLLAFGPSWGSGRGLQCGPIAWELVRNADFRAPPRLRGLKFLGVGPGLRVYNLPRGLSRMLRTEELPRGHATQRDPGWAASLSPRSLAGMQHLRLHPRHSGSESAFYLITRSSGDWSAPGNASGKLPQPPSSGWGPTWAWGMYAACVYQPASALTPGPSRWPLASAQAAQNQASLLGKTRRSQRVICTLGHVPHPPQPTGTGIQVTRLPGHRP